MSISEVQVAPDATTADVPPVTLRVRRLHPLVRNVFSNWVGLALNMAAAFFMSPFLVRSLGDTWYGLWVLIRSTTGYMSLLDGGLRVSIVKYVARHNAMDDADELSRTISTAFMIYLAVAGLVALLTLVLGIAFPVMFKIPPDTVRTVQWVVLIAGLSVATSLVGAVFGGFVAGMQRYDLGNAMGIVLLVARTLAIVPLILMGYGIVGLGLVHLVTQVISSAYMVRLCYRLRPDLRISIRYVNRESAKTLYSYSVFVLLNNVANLLLFRSGEVVAGGFLGAAAVTYYSIAGTLTEYLQRIIVTMTMVLHPYSSAKDARGDAEGLKKSAVGGTKLCLVIALPVTVGLLLLGRSFIAAWMGHSYAALAAPVLFVLATARLFWFAQSSTGEILLGVGKHKQVAVLNLMTGVLSIISGAILVRPYGLVGMVIGASVPLVLIQGIVVPSYALRTLRVSVSEYFLSAVARPLLGTMPFAVALGLITRFADPQTLLGIAGAVTAAAPALLLGVYLIAFSPGERQALLRAVSGGRVGARAA